MPKTAHVKRERKVITYSEFWYTSGILLDRAKEEPKGSYHQVLASLIFSAFALEAYLNHLGEQLFKSWGEIEKKLQPKEKIALICEKISLAPAYSKAPWQVVPKLVGFRNKIAHGKNAFLEDEKTVPLDKYEEVMHEWLLVDWQEQATVQNADRIRKQLEQLLSLLHSTAGIKGDNLFLLGPQSSSASVGE